MKIYSVHFNRPDYAQMQYQISQDLGHNLVIVNNGPSPEIHKFCAQNQIPEIPVKNQSIRSFSHAQAIHQLFKMCPESEDCGIIDHDIFLCKNIQFNDYDIITWKQSRGAYNYFWPGFLFWKKHIPMKNINFAPNGIGDTGANTNSLYCNNQYKILEVAHKHILIDNSNQSLPTNGYTNFYSNNQLLAVHAINASNWHSKFSPRKELYIKHLVKEMRHSLKAERSK